MAKGELCEGHGSSRLKGGREEATTGSRFLGATDGSRAEGQTAVVTRGKRFHRYAEVSVQHTWLKPLSLLAGEASVGRVHHART